MLLGGSCLKAPGLGEGLASIEVAPTVGGGEVPAPRTIFSVSSAFSSCWPLFFSGQQFGFAGGGSAAAGCRLSHCPVLPGKCRDGFILILRASLTGTGENSLGSLAWARVSSSLGNGPTAGACCRGSSTSSSSSVAVSVSLDTDLFLRRRDSDGGAAGRAARSGELGSWTDWPS